jgi:hypothetical protein
MSIAGALALPDSGEGAPGPSVQAIESRQVQGGQGVPPGQPAPGAPSAQGKYVSNLNFPRL